MEEKDFEKKGSKKKFIIIGIIALILVALIVGGIIFLNLRNKPEKIFSKVIKDIFKAEEEEIQNSMKMSFELSAEIDSDDVDIRAVNEYLKAIKLGIKTEQDLDKGIANLNINAKYDGEEVISIDALFQDENIYFYLNDLYSKYIKVDEKYLEDIEDNQDLSELYESLTEFTEAFDEEFFKEIEELLLEELKTKEFEQEKVELDGEKVRKSTLKLSVEDFLKISKKVLKIVNEHQPMDEIEDLIEQIDDEIEYAEDNKNYLEISIYTKGFKNEFVKAEVLAVNKEDDQLVGVIINKKDETTTIDFVENEESTKLKDATEILKIAITQEDENKGTIKVTMNVEDTSIKMKIKYDVELGAKVEKRDVSKAVGIDELDGEDFKELLENIEDNETLYSLINLIANNNDNDIGYDYDYDYDYDWDDDDYDYDYDWDDDDWDYDYDYDYDDDYNGDFDYSNFDWEHLNEVAENYAEQYGTGNYI